MAAPPVKSQPLHNFSLPHLKWAHKTSSSGASSSSHRLRRRDSPDQHGHRCPETESETETQPINTKQQQPPAGSSINDSVLAASEEEHGERKPWNLRPRKEVIRAALGTKKELGAENNDNRTNSNCNGVKSQRLRRLVEGGQQNGGVERKTKRKVWISLSKEEIEEDVYALTGGKPPRRPKKWPKNVQKQLESVFPGLYLVGVAADSYRGMLWWIWRWEGKWFAATVPWFKYTIELLKKDMDTAEIY